MHGLSKNIISAKSLLLSALIVAITIFSGCSDERNPTTLPDAHPASWMDKSSADFHGSYVGSSGFEACKVCHGTDLDGGKVQVSCVECHSTLNEKCAACHGGLANESGAPPYGLRGETSDTTVAVGAHTVHLEGSALAGGIPCNSCHNVPLFILDSLHLDLGAEYVDSVAEIAWHGLADGSGAVWDHDARTCTGTYCHGNFSGGDNTNVPVWTDENQADCGSCHDTGDDPASLGWKHAYHVGGIGLSCGECHSSIIDTLNNITEPSLHVNGVIDTLVRDQAVCDDCHGTGPISCTFCHGGIDNQTGAPPVGLSGETSTTDIAVGAHTSHLEGEFITNGFNCTQCHILPATISDPGHIDADSVAELTWGTLAGNQSDWNRNTATCTGTYCHGNFAGGYADNSPVWTESSQAHCGSCHDIGYTPSDLGWRHGYHVSDAGLKCADCHSSVVDASLTIIGRDLHVNGAADTLVGDTAVCNQCHGPNGFSCIACHGGIDNETGAPPEGLRGETSTATLPVGAHTSHVSDGSLADAFDCDACHIKPDSINNPGHLGIDSVAEITWGDIAPATGALWSHETGTCTGTYCHGNFAGGKTSNIPIWTGSNQAQCGSCHDVGTNPSQLRGRHERHVSEEGLACYRCHSTTVNSTNSIIGQAVHIDGNFDVSFSSGAGIYSNGTCTGVGGGCHGTENWY